MQCTPAHRLCTRLASECGASVSDAADPRQVCLDRGDFIGQVNIAADDGLTMLPSVDAAGALVPGRALLRSWKVPGPAFLRRTSIALLSY